ncbi:MAG: AI-2E family transporter [Breznakibacter sp.]
MAAPQQLYTFDRVVRMVISTLMVIGILLLIRRLSAVLIPFFVAVFLVYLIEPFVELVQRRLHLKKRIYAVLVALFAIVLTVVLLVRLAVPAFVAEMVRMGNLVAEYMDRASYTDILPGELDVYLKEFFEHYKVTDYLNPQNLSPLLQKAMSQVWTVVEGSYQVFTILAGITIVLLYVVFLLLDFENFQKKWPEMIPQKYRSLSVEVISDLKHGMHTYFRMQGLIALIVGILSALGFWIIDLPLGIMMGLFLGFLNLVPYLQLVGLIPAFTLAMLSALDSGRTFWHEAFMVLLVVSIVQLIQDLYLTPRIMGKAYGLNPAVMLLSLSIWGSLLGFIGLLLALPLTTILMSYYKRFVLRDGDESDPDAIIASPSTEIAPDPPPSSSPEAG